MIFITGPLYSGKRTFAQMLPGKALADVQQLAADAADREVLCRWTQSSVPTARRRAGLPACWPHGQSASCRCSAASQRF